MKQLHLLGLFFFTSLLFSQSKIDSLQRVYANTTLDTVKIKALLELYKYHRYDSPEKAKEVLLESIQLSNNTEHIDLQVTSYNRYAEFLRTQSYNDSAISIYAISAKLAEKANLQKSISDIFNGLGYIYLRKGNYKKALMYHQKNLEVSIKMKDTLRMAWSYGAIGSVYNEMGEYTKAMENYVLSSKNHEGLKNLRDYAINFSNMGMLQRKLENYDSAKQYLKKSDSVFNEINFRPGRAFVLTNLALISSKTGNLEEAIDFNKQALANYEHMGNRSQAAEINYALGNIYFKQDKLNLALVHFQKKLQTSIDIKDSTGISTAYRVIGDCHGKLGEASKSKSNYLKALEVAIASDNRLGQMRTYESLAKTYAKEGNFTKAYESKNQYAILRDSLYTKEKRDLATEIEAKYQNEEQTKEITLLESEKELQTLQLTKRVNERNAIIAFTIILLLLAGLLYNLYRIKQKTNKELRELDRLKSNFFANISHEFRTPLTLIKGPIEQMEQNPSEGLQLESIKMIRRNTNRVLQLVNQLLDLSKIDKNNLKLEQAEGEVFKCLRGAASSFASHAAQRGIDYKVQIPHEVLWASFDRDKLEKIVYNLLGNAFKFSDDGGTISFSVSYLNDDLRLVVSDTGKGIPEEKLPFIFDRFYQVQGGTTREHEGSGIGLSLSKELVGLMDGTITATSEINKGTIFTVALPVQKIKTGTLKEAPAFQTDASGVMEKKPYEFNLKDSGTLPTLLLVEDNPDMSFFIKEHLQNRYNVKEATNGKIGLAAARKNPPDLIITDVMMPVMDGVELCKTLKSDLDTSHIPIVMLTAKAGVENKIEGLETGADDYLTKPFEPKELLARVKNLIEQRRKLRELFVQSESTIDPKMVTVTSLDQKFMEQVLTLLEERHFDASFGTTQMQEALAMSKTQLHRKLKALTNEAPGELLRNFRLKRAAQLLTKKADTVTQIAYAVGFNNLSYFAKCFKELYGVPPSSY
ncbi:tetratricopeptide repeat protein [Flagellimonas sp. S3867]|uniref:tetratricopeptide repeat protein n=1 Tax=Flagellimonas sp. S3867 TaxID=2768063 RepID=UPI00168431EA|nr:tetratricopeptide repeat protein [Flagellimonas sp. S3867]